MSKETFQTPEVSKRVQLSDYYPLIRETLADAGTFTLTITGSSMWPTILGGRDRVTLSALPEKMKKYDLPLYRRSSGQFVLHRIVSINRDGTYNCCGDHQWAIERGLRQEQMVGIVTQIERIGKSFSVQNRKYRRWVHFWCAVLPLRPLIFKVHYYNVKARYAIVKGWKKMIGVFRKR